MDPMHKFEVQRTGKGAIERTTWTLLGRGHPGNGKVWSNWLPAPSEIW